MSASDLTLADLRTELQARGFDYVTPTTRLDAWLNRAYFETAEEENWPWLETSTSSTAPVSVTDLRDVEAVINTTQGYKLRPMDRRNITDFDSDLTTAGSPSFYYITTGNVVAVYPANTTDTIEVRYWKVPEILGDTDTPLVPNRFRQILVDKAVAFAYVDSDNFEGARSALELYQDGLARMRESLLSQQDDEPDDSIVVYGSIDW
jgi:hypothetical protein